MTIKPLLLLSLAALAMLGSGAHAEPIGEVDTVFKLSLKNWSGTKVGKFGRLDRTSSVNNTRKVSLSALTGVGPPPAVSLSYLTSPNSLPARA